MLNPTTLLGLACILFLIIIAVIKCLWSIFNKRRMRVQVNEVLLKESFVPVLVSQQLMSQVCKLAEGNIPLWPPRNINNCPHIGQSKQTMDLHTPQTNSKVGIYLKYLSNYRNLIQSTRARNYRKNTPYHKNSVTKRKRGKRRNTYAPIIHTLSHSVH